MNCRDDFIELIELRIETRDEHYVHVQVYVYQTLHLSSYIEDEVEHGEIKS